MIPRVWPRAMDLSQALTAADVNSAHADQLIQDGGQPRIAGRFVGKVLYGYRGSLF